MLGLGLGLGTQVLVTNNTIVARNFHLGAMAQRGLGTEVPQWGPGANPP